MEAEKVIVTQLEKEWLTVPEAARHARCSNEHIRAAIFAGELPAYKRTKSSMMIIEKGSINAWIKQKWLSA